MTTARCHGGARSDYYAVAVDRDPATGKLQEGAETPIAIKHAAPSG